MPKTYVYLLRIRYSNDFEISYDGRPGVENSVTHGSGEMDEALGQIRTSVNERPLSQLLCCARFILTRNGFAHNPALL